MVLRSGYALVMHGDSRLRMHGVAKVFPCPCGDASRAKRVAGAAKKPKRGAGSSNEEPCECRCSSFDEQLDPGAEEDTEQETETEEGEEGPHLLLCHEDLRGVECASHRRSRSSPPSAAAGAPRETSERSPGSSLLCPSCAQPALCGLEVRRVLKFLQTARVNVNVRQVYPSGTRPALV